MNRRIVRNSFVVATDIHYPTDSGLIGDGLRTIVATARRLAGLLGVGGWRQHRHLLRAVKKHLRAINRIAAGKGRPPKPCCAWPTSPWIPRAKW